MKTVIKTTLKGSENITVKENVDDIFSQLVDKGGFCKFTRIESNRESKIIIKKTLVKLVVERK